MNKEVESEKGILLHDFVLKTKLRHLTLEWNMVIEKAKAFINLTKNDISVYILKFSSGFTLTWGQPNVNRK